MAFCEQCGAQIADDSVFCEQCGTRQSAIARQIPAVEVDPREESAEETPLPEQLSAATEASGFVRTENTAGSTSFPC